MILRRFSAIVLCSAIGVACFAQTFELASVKLAEPVQGAASGAVSMKGGPGTGDPTHVIYRHVPLRAIVRTAYDVKDDQITAPEWMFDGQKYGYDLTATMRPGTTPAQFRIMLQSLLANRFHLKVNQKSKQLPRYELLVARGGPTIKQAAPQQAALADAPKPVSLNTPQLDADGFPWLGPGRSEALKTPRIGEWGEIRATLHMSMDDFAAWLAAEINASNGLDTTAPIPRVVNRSGLTGKYGVKLHFAGGTFFPAAADGPYVNAIRAEHGDAALAANQAPEPEGRRGGGISLFDALKQQAGLELKKTRDVEVEIEVVSADRVPRPN